MSRKKNVAIWLAGSVTLMSGFSFLSAPSVFAQAKPLIQQQDLSNKSLEDLWKAANVPGQALCFIKMNKDDQLAVIVSPSLGFGAIMEKGRSGKLNLGYQTDSHATAKQKENMLTISYKGDEHLHLKACTVQMHVEQGKIRTVKASDGCSDYEDGQDHFEKDLIGASALLSNAH
ncbi:hypothetical protein FAI41_06955 [Acetobacteraceae bacterium]|nr:hypothetical protein FAI41_06955 [Acetobacteraceae bacterium]